MGLSTDTLRPFSCLSHEHEPIAKRSHLAAVEPFAKRSHSAGNLPLYETKPALGLRVFVESVGPFPYGRGPIQSFAIRDFKADREPAEAHAGLGFPCNRPARFPGPEVFDRSRPRHTLVPALPNTPPGGTIRRRVDYRIGGSRCVFNAVDDLGQK